MFSTVHLEKEFRISIFVEISCLKSENLKHYVLNSFRLFLFKNPSPGKTGETNNALIVHTTNFIIFFFFRFYLGTYCESKSAFEMH